MGNNGSRRYEGRPVNDEDVPFLQALSDKRCLDWRNSPDLSADDQRRIKKEQLCLPIHISANVFLSDHRSAQQVGRLKHLGIAFVLNVGGKAVEPSNLDDYRQQGIEYKMIDAASKESTVLESYLSDVREFIAKAREQQRNVLVYCKTGYDLSGLFVASEKMLLEGKKVLQTVSECRRLRGNEFLTRVVLQEQLLGLARRTGLLGIKPGEEGAFVELPDDAEAIAFDPVKARGALTGDLQRATSRGSTRSHSSAGSQRSFESDLAASFSSSIKSMFNSVSSLSQGSSAVTQIKKSRQGVDADQVFLSVIRDPLCLNWRNRPDASGQVPTLEQQEKISKDQKNLPIQVCENIYLGNIRAINRVGRLKFLGITHVLNLEGPDAAPSSMDAFADAEMTYKMINATGHGDISALDMHLAEVRDFAAQSRQCGGNCVFYCKTGADVSALFAAAEKMLSEGISVLETVAQCRRLRGNSFLQNDFFHGQLVMLAKKHDLLGRAEHYLEVLPSDKLKNIENKPLLS